MNISRLRINCASLGALTSSAQGNNPPSDKEWKDFFNYINREKDKLSDRMISEIKNVVYKQVSYDHNKLSDTVKKELCKIYAYEIYGKGSVNAGGTKPLTMDKGRLAEPDAIQMLSRLDGQEYVKNEKLIGNRWFKGIPDIINWKEKKVASLVKDIKVSYDLPSFLMLFNEPCDKGNSWQMTGYLDILQLDEGEICHCLVNMPEAMMQTEVDRVMNRCKEMDMEQTEIEMKLLELKMNMMYDEIPEELRVVRYKVTKNTIRLNEAKARVRLARKWLAELNNEFQKPLTLLNQQESNS